MQILVVARTYMCASMFCVLSICIICWFWYKSNWSISPNSGEHNTWLKPLSIIISMFIWHQQKPGTRFSRHYDKSYTSILALRHTLQIPTPNLPSKKTSNGNKNAGIMNHHHFCSPCDCWSYKKTRGIISGASRVLEGQMSQGRSTPWSLGMGDLPTWKIGNPGILIMGI